MTYQSSPSPLPQEDSSADELVSDAELMGAVKSGDKLAFSELYDRHAASVQGVCMRVLHRQSEAEAVVSDVFWEIWRKPERFNPLRGGFCTYLFMMARSRAIDRLRASATRDLKTRAAMQEALGGVQGIQDSQEPCEEILADERRQAVREAVGQLEQEQRDALLLAYFDGHTHREISERMDLPLGTVKTRIRQGLLSLRAVLKSLGGRDGL